MSCPVNKGGSVFTLCRRAAYSNGAGTVTLLTVVFESIGFTGSRHKPLTVTLRKARRFCLYIVSVMRPVRANDGLEWMYLRERAAQHFPLQNAAPGAYTDPTTAGSLWHGTRRRDRSGLNNEPRFKALYPGTRTLVQRPNPRLSWTSFPRRRDRDTDHSR